MIRYYPFMFILWHWQYLRLRSYYVCRLTVVKRIWKETIVAWLECIPTSPGVTETLRKSLLSAVGVPAKIPNERFSNTRPGKQLPNCHGQRDYKGFNRILCRIQFIHSSSPHQSTHLGCSLKFPVIREISLSKFSQTRLFLVVRRPTCISKPS